LLHRIDSDMVDRAGDRKFSVSEKAKLKRFVGVILARRLAQQKIDSDAARRKAGGVAPPKPQE
jgi:hypothetical protein